MAWTETFHCDVCGKEKSEETEDWWLAWIEPLSPSGNEPEQPTMRVTRWNGFLAHSAETKHLCGVGCAHTVLDRWMLAHD